MTNDQGRMTNQFKSAVVASKLTTACIKFDQYLAKNNRPPFTEIRQKLRHELNDYQHQKMLSVVVVGQYGARKSTLISALTGLPIITGKELNSLIPLDSLQNDRIMVK